jgi:hypothetical protein
MNLSVPKNLVESWFTFPGTKIFQFVFFPQLDLSLKRQPNFGHPGVQTHHQHVPALEKDKRKILSKAGTRVKKCLCVGCLWEKVWVWVWGAGGVKTD